MKAYLIVFLVLQAARLGADTAITGVVIHPVSGPSVTNGALVFNGQGKIVSVGAGAAPAGADAIPLNGLHVFPGLIAASTSLGLIEIDSVRSTVDSSESGEFSPEIQAWQAVNPDSEIIPTTRASGITHAEVAPAGATVAGWSGVVQLAGWTVEDLTIRKRAALHVTWPSFSIDFTPKSARPRDEHWKSPQDQVGDREKRLRELDESFNAADAYAKLEDAHKSEPGFKRVPAWEAMRSAVKGEAPVFIHADETRQIESAVGWLAKRGYKGAIVGGMDAWRCPGVLASNHIPVVYTRVFSLPARTVDPYDVQYAAPSVLHKAGVRVVLGDGQGSPSFLRNLPFSAGQASAYGLPREEALRSVTLYPAELLGIADRLGTLETGKDATFVVADGDILEPRTHVLRVWIAGREADLSNRHTRLYDRYRNRPAAKH
jgi:imidazolonepropionase-like amidohydrolase